jgi:hypothetical protein
MGRRGNCWEGLPLGYNAPTERFFRSLKHEQLPYEKFRAKASANLGIMGYLAFYNGKRSHPKLGYQPRWNCEGFIGMLPKKVSGFS